MQPSYRNSFVMFLDLCVRHAVGFRDRHSSTKQKRAGLHQSRPSEVSASAPSYFDDFVSGQDQLQPILPDLEGATSSGPVEGCVTIA